MLYTITCQIAYITPPFGYNLFLMRAHRAEGGHARRHLPVHLCPSCIMMVGVIVLVGIFPQLALWLPHYIYAK